MWYKHNGKLSLCKWFTSVYKIFSNMSSSHLSSMKAALFFSPTYSKCLKFCLTCSRLSTIYVEFNFIFTAPTFYRREISVGLALCEPSSVPQDTCEAGRVVWSSLLLQSSSFCLITKTFLSVYTHCIPLSPSFCNTHGEVLEPPGDEVRGALSPAPWPLISERSL